MTDILAREALSPAEQYQRELDALLRRVDQLEEQAVRRVTQYLVEARRRINERLGQLPDDAYLSQFLSSLRVEIDDALRAYVAQYIDEVASVLPTASTLGVQAVDSPLAAAGVNVMARLPSIDPSFLTALEDMRGSLIANISTPAAQEIVTAIYVASLSQDVSIHMLQRQVSAILRTELRPDDTLKDYAAHAEMLVRTNLNGAFNRATVIRQNQFLQRVQQVFPDVEPEKVWLTAKDARVRDSHRRMEGKHVHMSDLFTLLGADGVTYKVTGPHDPRLPASEACNCRCRTVLDIDSVMSILEGA